MGGKFDPEHFGIERNVVAYTSAPALRANSIAYGGDGELDKNGRLPPAEGRCDTSTRGGAMLSALIRVLIICVIGAICFWAIDKFARDGRLANLLKLFVVLICLAAILLPLAGIGWL